MTPQEFANLQASLASLDATIAAAERREESVNRVLKTTRFWILAGPPVLLLDGFNGYIQTGFFRWMFVGLTGLVAWMMAAGLVWRSKYATIRAENRSHLAACQALRSAILNRLSNSPSEDVQ